MSSVWKHSTRREGELLVLLALADFADDNGGCFPSVPRLAAKARLSERQTRKVLAKLIESGEVRKVGSNGGRNRRNHYFVSLPENPEQITLKKEQGKKNRVLCDTETLSCATQNPVAGDRGIKPSRNHQENRQSFVGDSDHLSVSDFLESWNSFFQGKLPQVKLPLSASRGKKARVRLREHPGIDFWQQVFEKIWQSDFLMGRNGNGNSSWRVTFDWLIENDCNCLKVWEGNYDGSNRK